MKCDKCGNIVVNAIDVRYTDFGLRVTFMCECGNIEHFTDTR